MNPFKTDVCIMQNEVLGEAELIEPQNVQIILTPEGCEPRKNQSVRKIQIDNSSQKGNNSSNLSKSYTQQEDDSSESTNVPDYLSDLYCRAIQERTF